MQSGNNATFSIETFDELLSRENTRETLTYEQIKNFFDHFNAPDQLTAIKKLLIFADTQDESKLKALITPILLTELACLNGFVAQYIFSNAFCLDIFVADIRNFATHLLALAEYQTRFCYQICATYQAAGSRQLEQLIGSIEKDNNNPILSSRVRKIHSQLLSFWDKLPEDEKEGRYSFSRMLDGFGGRRLHDLVDRDDGGDNFTILCRSESMMEKMIPSILLNKLAGRNDAYKNISMDLLIAVVKNYPKLVYLVVNPITEALVKNATQPHRAEWLNTIEQLLKILEERHRNGDLHASLAFASVLFFGLSSLGRKREDALSICFEVCEKTAENKNEGLNHKAHALLCIFANQYCSDSYSDQDKNSQQKQKDILQAYTLYQYIQEEILGDFGYNSGEGRAKKQLCSPKFTYYVSYAAASDMNYELALKISCAAIKPQLPENVYSSLYDKDRENYYDELCYFGMLQAQLAQSVANVLNTLAEQPVAGLQLAQELINAKSPLLVAKILRIIQPLLPTTPETLMQNLGECAFKLGVELIGLGHYPISCSLFAMVSKQCTQYEAAQNFLQFAASTFKQAATRELPKDLSREEQLTIIKQYYENAHHQIEEIGKFLISKPQYVERVKQELEPIKKEIGTILQGINHEIDRLQKKIIQKKLPTGIQEEIKKGCSLKSPQVKPKTQTTEQNLNALCVHGFLKSPATSKAKSWFYNDEKKEWIRRPC